MAACVKDPVLNGAPLAGKEDPVTPTTRRTIPRKEEHHIAVPKIKAYTVSLSLLPSHDRPVLC